MVARRVSVPRWSSGSLLWRIFAVNAIVFGTAVALLALTPAHVHARTRWSEVVMLIAGLALVLCADFVLIARTLVPLRRLVDVMGAVDARSPRQRATLNGSTSDDVRTLAEAFNEMLDRLEAERRESERRKATAQEAERRRIARELHDEIGQSLTAVALRAEYAATRPPEAEAVVREIVELAQRGLEDVRRMANQLRPEVLDDLGLVNALLTLCSRVAPGTRVRRAFDEQLPELTSEQELVIYRIAQEALTNAVRHAPGSVVDLALRGHQERVVLTVRDYGPGLAAGAVPGNGLTGMRERAELVGAELSIGSVASGGAEIVLVMPVAEVGT
ncbi:MAG TPA: sensor histidine kinase [Solirubrobacteraceae bacterium]|jgi:two-component system sensor histidine kinase UhpB|nr:sensor histidine kinase [Solirubrobacteraceae bacterium]